MCCCLCCCVLLFVLLCVVIIQGHSSRSHAPNQLLLLLLSFCFCICFGSVVHRVHLRRCGFCGFAKGGRVPIPENKIPFQTTKPGWDVIRRVPVPIFFNREYNLCTISLVPENDATRKPAIFLVVAPQGNARHKKPRFGHARTPGEISDTNGVFNVP